MNFGDKWLEQLFRRYYYELRWYGDFEIYTRMIGNYYLTDEPWFPSVPLKFDDLSSIVESIRSYARENELFQKPIKVTICIYPGSGYELPTFDQDSNIFQVYVEARPISRHWSKTTKEYRPLVGGISIGSEPEGYGTLGGILTCKTTGKLYGITCAHVMGDNKDVFQPARADSGTKVIGRMLSKSELIELPQDHYKNKDLSSANDMDAAIIELTENDETSVLDLGKIDGFFPERECTPYQSVSFTGRTSGYRYFLENDADVPFYDLFIGEKKYRYKNLMQIRFKSKYDMLFSEPSKEGDSGAWICMPKDEKMLWAGMVIGGYFQTAFAIPSERILQWIKDDAKLDLNF